MWGVAHLQLVNPQRAGAELLGHVHQLLVQAGDDGSDGDHRGGADQHAQDGEERAELVRAERVQRQQQVLARRVASRLRHGSHFSVRSASMGSSAGRFAGGVNAEEQAHGGGKAHAHQHRADTGPRR